MIIEEHDVIKLSNDINYLVVKIVIVDNITYYYLISFDDKQDFKFLYQDGNELVEVTDDKLKKKIALNIAKDILSKDESNN